MLAIGEDTGTLSGTAAVLHKPIWRRTSFRRFMAPCQSPQGVAVVTYWNVRPSASMTAFMCDPLPGFHLTTLPPSSSTMAANSLRGLVSLIVVLTFRSGP